MEKQLYEMWIVKYCCWQLVAKLYCTKYVYCLIRCTEEVKIQKSRQNIISAFKTVILMLSQSFWCNMKFFQCYVVATEHIRSHKKLGKGNQGSTQTMNTRDWQKSSFLKQINEHEGLEDFPSLQFQCPVTVVSENRNYFIRGFKLHHPAVL